MTRYINAHTAQGIETIDELPFNTVYERREFRRVMSEYQLSYYGTGIHVYSSRRSTKDWKDK